MLKKQARVTSKGQITLPFEVRHQMGVRSGDRVEFGRKMAPSFRVPSRASRGPV